MDHYYASPLAVTLGFVDAINRGDIDRLASMMTEDYELKVFHLPPEAGLAKGVAGWRGYASAYPRYLIHPSRLAVQRDTVAVLGTTTGSHLALPDDEEMQLTLIWLSEVSGGKVRRWILIEDTPENRGSWGLD